MMTLFDVDISGNCYKVRLMLALLGLSYKTQPINLRAGEQKTVSYLAHNPFGLVPVLQDGEHYIRDSQAILVYLAKTYGDEQWFPNRPLHAAQVIAWLSTASNEVARGPAALRAHHKLGKKINIDEAVTITDNLLAIVDNHLAQHQWLVGDNITIADIAMYPYLALAHEGNIDVASYKHLDRWLARIAMLEGFIGMPGIQTQSHEKFYT